MINILHPIIIAVDGFSSCGKSSFAKLIALETNYIYIDSGAMYRSVTHYAIQKGLIKGKIIDSQKLISDLPKLDIRFDSSNGKVFTYLNDENIESEIRDIKVSESVSLVSKIPEVRERLVQLQQAMGKLKKVVMDGRDIGTIVFPDAEVKIYMMAGVDVRAKRRYDELLSMGKDASFAEVKKNIEERDYTDLNREVSPLRKADDALELDNSYMDFEKQLLWFKEVLQRKGLTR